MSHNPTIVLAVLFAVFVILSVFRPGGFMSYFVPSLCWATIALTTVFVCGFEKILTWTNRRITLVALLIAFFQIFILIDAGLINKFGKSPLSFTPTGIILNLMLVASTLLGMELSRAYLTRTLIRKNPTLVIVAVTLLYTFINVSILTVINFQDTLTYAKFMGESFLPTLTENLLATYLTLLSGPAASVAYRAPLQTFQWFSPILPDLPWGYQSLIAVMIPTIGFISISMATTQTDLRKAGIPTKIGPAPRPRKSQTPMKGWMVMSILLVLTVWTSTGLFGFYPTIVASGSMRPTLEVGDLAIVIQTPIEKIKAGDIIQYFYEHEMRLHRVIDIRQEGSTRLFVTKGDDNPSPDPELVIPSQIRGKLIFNIPKLGWASITIKNAISQVWSILSSNLAVAYSMIGLASATCIYKIYMHKSHAISKLKRPNRRRGWLRK